MKNLIWILLTVTVLVSLTWCSLLQQETPQPQPVVETPVVNEQEGPELNLDEAEYVEVVDPEVFTVNQEPITIDNRLSVGDVLVDIPLDQPVGEFDKIETLQLSELEWFTMIYSVPSLDTPVCTRQTKEIEEAWKQFPEYNFAIISHDTPFALKRFCGDEGITNILTLSDWRSKEFAQQNGLYMNEYDLMTRGIVIVNDDLEVVYVDYADEVTDEVDLINAFAFLLEQNSN